MAAKKRKPAARKRASSRRKPPARRWPVVVGKLALVLLLLFAAYIVYLDVTVTRSFDGRKWAVPARMYARPLEMYPDQTIDADALQQELRLVGYRPVERVQRAGQYSRHGDFFAIKTHGFHFWDGEEPPRTIRFTVRNGRISRLQVSDEAQLLRLEPALIGRIYPGDKEDRIVVALGDTPKWLVPALLATEDRRFFHHHGVSLRGIARAMWHNLLAGGFVEGGSTLTQQLVKNFYLSHERSLLRKVNEALMALLLEWHYDKEAILSAYINEVFLGQYGQYAVHGFGLAAHHFFARPLKDLNLAESATLVAMVKGASYYNPRRHPQRARERRNLVIDLMAKQGMIDAGQAAQAKASALGVVAKAPGSLSRYPAFTNVVRRQLFRDYDEDDLRSEGLQIHTTLDPQAQAGAEAAIQGLPGLEKSMQLTRNRLQGAMVVLAPGTSEVLAVVGGRHPKDAGFNRAVDAVRPIGSLVKPAVYATALGRDGGYTATSVIEDASIELQQPDGSHWQPQNYDKQLHGRVPLHRALSESLNLATVRLGLDVGLRKVIRQLQHLGIDKDIPAYPSVLLGSLELSPMQVAQVYQAIANGGFLIPPRAIRAVTTADNQPLERYRLSVRQAIDPDVNYILVNLLQEAFRDGTGRHAAARLGHPALAGKTGTTDDLRDSWFAGFGQHRLAVVWLGRDDNTPAGLTGASGALRIFTRFVKRAGMQAIQRPAPDGVTWFWVDEERQRRTDKACANGVRYPYLDGSEPSDYEPCNAW